LETTSASEDSLNSLLSEKRILPHMKTLLIGWVAASELLAIYRMDGQKTAE
jgi:hypothetical protein